MYWLEFRLPPCLILVGLLGSFDLSRRDKKEYAFKTCRSQTVRKWQSLATNTGTGIGRIKGWGKYFIGL